MLASLLLALTLSAPALAQDDGDDDDIDLLEDDETDEEHQAREAEERARLQDADDMEDLLGDDEDIEALDDVELGEDAATEDLLGEEIEQDTIGGPGHDTAEIYRSMLARTADMIVDEEVIAWEGYLKKYPQSSFRDRIEQRTDELMDEMYSQRIRRDDPGRLDADQREILFSQGLLIENLNPRTRIQGGFEWGLPDYMNLMVDYEHQLRRDLSVHAGLRHRYTGWAFGPGVRWAFIKSARTKTIVALLADFQLNFDPFFLGLRPQVGVGRKFGALDLQLQAGVDVDTRAKAAPKAIGGLNATYYASDNIAGFLETSLYMGNLAWDQGDIFRFNLATFGLKFYPRVEPLDLGQVEINVGASVPYTSSYWMYHYGSIMGQVNYYL